MPFIVRKGCQPQRQFGGVLCKLIHLSVSHAPNCCSKPMISPVQPGYILSLVSSGPRYGTGTYAHCPDPFRLPRPGRSAGACLGKAGTHVHRGPLPRQPVYRRHDASQAWKKYYAWPDSYARFVEYIFARYQANNVLLSPIHFDTASESIPATDFMPAIDMALRQRGA